MHLLENHLGESWNSWTDLLQWRTSAQSVERAFTFLDRAGAPLDSLSYPQLQRRSNAVASALAECHPEGARVLLLHAPGLDFIVSLFGCLAAGVVAVPTQAPISGKNRRALARLASIVPDAGPEAVLTSSSVGSRLHTLWDELDLPELPWYEVDALPIGSQCRAPDRRIEPSTVAMLQYTAGSTGDPRGVVLTNANLLANARAISLALEQTSADRYLSWLPVFHDMGLMAGVLQPLYAGIPSFLMSPAAFLRDPLIWLQAISSLRVTISGGPNFGYELCLKRQDPSREKDLELSSWRIAFSGSEPVRSDTLDRFRKRFGAFGFSRSAFYPCYGLAEATLMVSGGRPDANPVFSNSPAPQLQGNRSSRCNEIVGCGRAAPGVEIRIVDVDSGVPTKEPGVGEIWVAGPSVASGYWQKTDPEVFGQRLGGSHERFLRTGDLGFMEGGELFVTGRLKDLLVVRGENYYPQDLERSAEACDPALRSGCSAAFALELGGDARIVIVVEVKGPRQKSLDQLADRVRRTMMDEHGINIHGVILAPPNTVPKTTSGKVQRGGCRDLFLKGTFAESAMSFAKPAGPHSTTDDECGHLSLSERMKALCAGVLHVDEVNMSLSFVDQGGCSVLALELQDAVATEFDVEVPLSTVLGAPTIRDLSKELFSMLDSGGAGKSITHRGPTDALRPSMAQESVLMRARLRPGDPELNITVAVHLVGHLNPEIVEGSLATIVERHEVLRCSFLPGDRGLVRILPNSAFSNVLDVVDLRAVPSRERDRRLKQALIEERTRRFDLVRTPLFFFRLLRLGQRRSILLLSAHHAILDGESVRQLLLELEDLYRVAASGQPSTWTQPPCSYFDASLWQRRTLTDRRRRELRRYWLDRLGGRVTPLEFGRGSGRVDEPSWGRQTFRVSAVDWQRLGRLARQEGATSFTAVLAIFSLLLSRLGNASDVIVGVPISGRDRRELRSLIGHFVKLLPVRCSYNGSESFRCLLGRTKNELLDAYSHSEAPVEQILMESKRSELQLARIQAVLSLRSANQLPTVNIEGLSTRVELLTEGEKQFDLTLSLTESAGGLAGTLTHSDSVLSPEEAQRFANVFVQLLRSACADADKPVWTLGMVKERERARLVSDSCGARRPCEMLDVSACFREAAARQPDAVAVRSNGRNWSYSELDRASEVLAARLVARGIGIESRVGILASRSAELVIGALGALKAGAAYAPLDPGHSVELIEFMIREAIIEVVVRGEMEKKRTLLGIPTLCLDGGDPNVHPISGPPDYPPGRLAYIIFTSGTTGTPKAVGVEHSSLANLVAWHRSCYNIQPSDRAALIAGVGFDASIWELWPYLCAGASVSIPDPGTVTDPSALRDWLISSGITIAFVPTHLASRLCVLPWPDDVSLRHLLTGGETLTIRPPANLPFRLVNHYGPTEGTVVATQGQVANEDGKLPSIGSAIDNVDVYLLDGHMELVPEGFVGEVFLGGAGVARAVLGRPDLTASRFVPDPFSRRPGARLYRTGDRGRRLPDRALEFLGRTDSQISVRGARIELDGVESTIERYPGIRACAVKPVQVRGESRLVAFVEPEAGVSPDPRLLRRFLRDWQPAAAGATLIRCLSELPRSASGKKDRSALPIAELRNMVSKRLVKPATTTEKTVQGICRGVLAIDRLSVEEDLFDCGLDSLSAGRVLGQIEAQLGVRAAACDLYERPTVRELSAFIDRLSPGSTKASAVCHKAQGREAVASYAQKRLYFLEKLAPTHGAYNHATALRLVGHPDATALQKSLNEIVRRHIVLRSHFRLRGEDVRLLASDHTVPVALVEGKPSMENLRERASVAFNIEQAPLLRADLFRHDEGHHTLLLVAHHAVFDGSVRNFWRELSTLYKCFRKGEPSTLPELELQYEDFARFQRESLSGGRMEELVDFWTRHLEGAPPVLDLPSDRPRSAEAAFAGNRLIKPLAAELLSGYQTLAKIEGTSDFTVALAVFLLLLRRYSGKCDLVVGIPVEDRANAAFEQLIGPFVNTVPVRHRLERDVSFVQWLHSVQSTLEKSQTHKDLPFERLVADLGLDRDASRNPLFQVMFAHMRNPYAELNLEGLQVEPFEVPTRGARCDLLCALIETDGNLQLSIEYDSYLYEEATIVRMASHFENLLSDVLARPDTRLSDLNLLSENERQLVTLNWNRTQSTYPAESTIHRIIERQCARDSDGIAVVAPDGVLSYDELNRHANRIARFLRRRGIKTGARVGVWTARTAVLAQAFLGVLKAGATFVPFDPESGLERVMSLVRLLDIQTLIVHSGYVEHFARTRTGGLDLVVVDATSRELARHQGIGMRLWSLDDLSSERDTNPRLPIGSATTAYIVFTSGSSGVPKGVAVSHRAVVNLVEWTRKTFEISARDRVLNVAPIEFDLSIFDFFGALASGASVRIVSREVICDHAALIRLLCTEPITIWNSAPVTLQQMLSRPLPCATNGARLRLVLLSGDWIPVSLPDAVSALFPKVKVWALGGATEATVWSNAYPVDTVEPHWQSIPYGRPIQNSQYLLLDAGMEPVPIGVPGDLYIGGDCLSEGYVGAPALTAETFVPDPFSEAGGRRLYRTGDRARFLPDGNIEFLGRADCQVKIRGFRVELGGIEALLRKHEVVRDAAVDLRSNGGIDRLVAYLVVRDGCRLDVGELRRFIGDRLPSYMNPSHFVPIREFPTTLNGKLDRSALPDPRPEHGIISSSGAETLGELEELVASIWRDVLQVAQVGTDDSFFELGGHSLQLVEVHRRLVEILEADFPMVMLFRFATVRTLCDYLRDGGAGVWNAHPEPSGVELRRGLQRLTSQRRRVIGLDKSSEVGG